MQSAETVLGILRERGRRGLPCNELYRQMFNPELYLVAYGRIYSNKGSMTPGATAETADGMSLGKIHKITELMRHERYRFSPVKRVMIPKKNGKLRPLGLPGWSDKLVGEVMRLLLEAYYEPQFSDRSHGFRPKRGCHTALREVANTWTGTTWLIEGDISDCFGSLDHEVMMSILAEKIHDNRFLRLLRNMLEAGYLEDWVWNATLSGAPQGGVLSPLLSNIYLHRLDAFVEQVLMPEYNRGTERAKNMAAKHKAKADTPHGPRKCFEAVVEREGRKPLVARYGGIPLRQQKTAVIQDRQPGRATGPKELVTRLLANRCEICERSGNVEVHHVRKLADLGKFGQAGRPAWAAIMAKRRRKSLVVCLECHADIHSGKPAAKIRGLVTGEPDARKSGKSGSGEGCPEKPTRELAGRPIPR